MACQNGMFCAWGGGEPDRGVCGDGYGPQAYVNIFGNTGTSVWDDTYYDGCGDPAGQTRCYACERSPCLQTDCNKGYTRPRGYYPACTCSTISASLSLPVTVTRSLPLTTTRSEPVTLSVSASPKTATASPTISATVTSSLSRTQSASVSTTNSISTSATLTRSYSLSLSSSISGNTVSLSQPATATPSGPTTTQTLTASASHSASASPSPSVSVSTTASYTLSVSATLSPTGGSASETATMQDSFSPTYYANTTLVAEFLSLLPLFTVAVYEDADIRAGSSRTVFVKPIREALWQLLFSAGNRRVRVRGVPVVKQTPALGDVGVTGNELGFFFAMPNTTILVPNSSALNLSLAALPSYAIEVTERMMLYTSMRELLDVVVLMDHGDVDELHLIGTIEVHKPDTGMSAPSVVTTVITTGAGALGGMAAELQGVGALALMGCSDPNTKSRFGAYRALSPLAVKNSYAGVIIGNGLLTGCVLVLQAAVVAVLRFWRRVQRNIELMSLARFPSLFFVAALAFHTGTAFSSAQIISRPSDYAGWEIFFGVGGFVYCLVLPVVMAAHPYLRVGRAYQTYEMNEWLAAKRWPSWLVWVVPRGATFSLETRQAYGLYISVFRAPPRHLFWTSLPTWTPLVFLVAGLFHPNTVDGCRALFACTGIAMVAISLLILWQAPLRSHTTGWLDVASRMCLGCVLFCMAAAIIDGTRLDAAAADAAFAFIVVMMCITALRVVHHVLCILFDHKMESEAIPLEIVWTHVIGGTKKKTHRFAAMDDDLRDIAGNRDDAGDESLQIVEDMDAVDEGYSAEENSDEEYLISPAGNSYEEEDDGYNGFYNDGLPAPRPEYAGISTVQDVDIISDDDFDGDDLGQQMSSRYYNSNESNDTITTPPDHDGVDIISLPSELGSDVSL